MAIIQNPVVLVTGASAGMGKAYARALIAEGATVYGVARRLENMDDIKAEGVITMKMDITEDDDIQRVIQTIEENHGGVDILINNAGYAVYGAMEDTDMSDVRMQFEVNFFGLSRLTQLVLPGMRKKKAGKIINVSSMGGKMYTPMGSWYIATKHAIEGWSDCLRIELKEFGIDVVIIEPGAISTEFGDVLSDPMIERSGSGPYKEWVKTLQKVNEKNLAEGNASPPKVVVDVVLKAIRSDTPKTRYIAGKLAKPMMFIRKYFGDRFFDWFIVSSLRAMANK
jgi:short-subunit dehydrogenase